MTISSLPTNPNAAQASLGKNFLIYVDTRADSATEAVWTAVGGQKTASLKRSAEEIDASCKTSGGWKTTLAGQKSWSLDMESVVVQDNTGKEALDYAYENGVQVHIKLEENVGGAATGNVFHGWAAVTDYSLDAPQDDVTTISATLSGAGALTTSEA